MNEENSSLARLARLQAPSALIGILGAILFFVGVFSGVPNVMHSYLFAFVFWGSLTIGCFGIMLLHGSLKSTWTVSVLRIIEAGGGPASLILLAVSFIPIALSMNSIYIWTDPNYVKGDSVLEAKQFWLNPGFFLVRTGFILAVWLLWSFLMKRSTRRQDDSMDKREWDFRANLGTPGLVMFFITVTLIATDWVMSIQPRYYSTIYGLIFTIGCGLSAMSLGVIIIMLNASRAPYKDIVNPKLTKDLGNILFMLTMLWGYLTLSQFLITWQGNLPLEAPYYLNRTGGPIGHTDNARDWNVLSGLVLLCQFFIPFFALLAPRTKAVVRNLTVVAVVIFITRILNVYWLVFPDLRNTSTLSESITHWTDYAAFFGMGGIWFALFFAQLQRAPLLPKFDTRLMEAEHA